MSVVSKPMWVGTSGQTERKDSDTPLTARVIPPIVNTYDGEYDEIPFLGLTGTEPKSIDSIPAPPPTIGQRIKHWLKL